MNGGGKYENYLEMIHFPLPSLISGGYIYHKSQNSATFFWATCSCPLPRPGPPARMPPAKRHDLGPEFRGNGATPEIQAQKLLDRGDRGDPDQDEKHGKKNVDPVERRRILCPTVWGAQDS